MFLPYEKLLFYQAYAKNVRVPSKPPPPTLNFGEDLPPLTKSRLSNQKSGMVLKVTLILNLKMNIDTKFLAPIFKNDEVRRRGYFNPPYVE